MLSGYAMSAVAQKVIALEPAAISARKMPQSIGRGDRRWSDGRVTRKPWCCGRKFASPFSVAGTTATDFSRGFRFSIPRPLTRPGGDFWFVKACRRPAALLHDPSSDVPFDVVLRSWSDASGEDAQPPRSLRDVHLDATVS